MSAKKQRRNHAGSRKFSSIDWDELAEVAGGAFPCEGDAYRFCSSHVPAATAAFFQGKEDPGMKACIISNKARLSPACRATIK